MNQTIENKDKRTRYIYKITCKINGKIYIGQALDYYERWNAHKCEARKLNPKLVINKAMKKHGVDNFTYEVIAICEGLISANNTEDWFIIYFDCRIQDKKGYNVNPGGGVIDTYLFLPQIKEYWSKIENREKSSQKMKKINASFSEEEKLSIRLKMIETKKQWSSDKKNEVSKNMSNAFFNSEKRKLKTKRRILNPNRKYNVKPGSSKTTFQQGSKHKLAKLTEIQVLEIITLCKNTTMFQKEIAKMFGVSRLTISSILTGRHWSHITGIIYKKPE
jgi:group I intron endonuclease